MNQGSEVQHREGAARVDMVHHKLSSLDTGAHSVALGPAPSALPGNLWEIQNLRPYPVPTDPETVAAVPGSCVFTDCPGGLPRMESDPLLSKLSIGMGGVAGGEVHTPLNASRECTGPEVGVA